MKRQNCLHKRIAKMSYRILYIEQNGKSLLVSIILIISRLSLSSLKIWINMYKNHGLISFLGLANDTNGFVFHPVSIPLWLLFAWCVQKCKRDATSHLSHPLKQDHHGQFYGTVNKSSPSAVATLTLAYWLLYVVSIYKYSNYLSTNLPFPHQSKFFLILRVKLDSTRKWLRR